MLKRPPGQNHFNAKLSGNQKRNRHGNKLAPSALAKTAKHLLQEL